MLTLDRKAQPLGLLEQQPLQPTFIAGLLFASLEIVPLSSEAPMTPLRVLGIVGLLAIASALVAHGLPRRRKRPFPLGKAAARPVRLELAGDALPPAYRAALVFADGKQRRVLEGADPAVVLDDAAWLSRELAIPLGPGWGLAEGALADLTGAPKGDPQRWGPEDRFTFEQPPLARQRAAAFTTLWASAFVLVATFVMADAPERKGLVPSTLSLVLPCLGAFILLVIGLWLWGLRERLVLERSRVTRSRFWFKRAIGRVSAQKLMVSSAALVTPASGIAGHLLIATETGLVALPAESREGARVLHPSGAALPAPERAAE